MEENDKIVKQSYTDPVTGKFVKGNPGGGRPQGSLDFKTKWFKFIEKVATQNDMTPEEIEQQLIAVGYKKAKEGDYAFYRDTFDRVYGKPINKTELTGADGKDFGIVMLPSKDESSLDTTTETNTSS
jgi:hypothetical protein